MTRATNIGLFLGLIAAALVGGIPAPTDGADMRPLGETATRLPRARIATSLEGGHSCAVVADGTVRCWGPNPLGQLGDGTINTPVASVRVTGITTAVAVTTGRDHSCALLVDATVRCWGANAAGQLGNGSFNPSFTPVTVSGLTNAVSISGGSLHTCVRRSDGTIACWGSNEFGQLGDDSFTNRPGPVPVRDISNARMVAAGSTHTCAVRVNGTVACWGGNGVGQLGRGVSGGDFAVPATVADLSGVWLVASGHRYSCALLASGRLKCWGLNDTGQLGDGTTNNSPSPIAVPDNSQPRTAVALGNGHGCQLRNILVECWGQNAAGEAGRGVAGAPEPSPVIVSGVNETVELVAGLDRSCALSASDVVLCWGENGAQQLANGSTADALTPTAVGGLGGSISARGVAAGLLHSCAWRADGTVACWGNNGQGALGAAPLAQSGQPVTVTGMINTTAVVGGEHHNCALQGVMRIFCWGRNIEGQVRPSFSDDVIRTPTLAATSRYTGLAAGARHSISLGIEFDAEDRTTGWGANDTLHLGDDETLGGYFRLDFIGAFNLGEVVSVGTGAEHTCALRVDGTVVCWGSNEFGQLGNNSSSTGATGIPQPVQGIVDAVAIAVGHLHTCALLVAGTVRCWGINQFGELGDGTRQERRTPVPVPGIGIGAAVGVVAGRSFTCILGVRGNVQCWGDNSNGELGDNTFTDRLTPGPVQRATKTLQNFFEGLVVTATTPLDQIVALVGGTSAHVCAVRVNGQPVCWGSNGNGRLGDGTTTNRPHAMGVASFLANIDPAAALHRNGRKAELTALVNCPEGARFRVRLELQQDHAEGHGQEEGKCEGGLARVPVGVSAQGRARFDEGAADARAVIDVRLKGEVIDHQEWGRVVNLTTP